MPMGIIDSLFNSFKETVFVKEDSDLIRQIEELKQVKGAVGSSKEIDKDIKLLEIGVKGENEISYELKNANLGLYVLRDITIASDDGAKAQIDYVIISKGFTYLVECKNLIGNIFVDSQGQFRREYELNGKIIKEAIYSPYSQAVRHKEILKKRWLARNSKLSVLAKEKYFDTLWYKPLVVLTNSKSLLNTKYAPKEIRNNTIRVDQLTSYIRKDLDNYDNNMLSTQKQMEADAQKWLEINVPEYNSIAAKYTRMSNGTSSTSGTDLLDRLKEFRTTKSRKMGVPAYYIFTDKELDAIVNTLPDSIEKLSGILPPPKVKYHGEDIIHIINQQNNQ